ncbi:hypothetical protein L6452_21011 [Arctium lappa]|uniref:Uncharacterized protein n=1 Tax=Arctium lappa TaxID=4217 RepID=A0ACB9BEA1_ARCLA|nr:hypothetical protein L6452_21011 [Arctium lappa]
MAKMVLKPISSSVVFVIVVSILASNTTGISGRRVHRDDDQGVYDNKELSSMLPRGIVPPSGPSPCHNMLDHKPTHFALPPFVPPFAPPFPFPFPFDPPPPPRDEIICP